MTVGISPCLSPLLLASPLFLDKSSPQKLAYTYTTLRTRSTGIHNERSPLAKVSQDQAGCPQCCLTRADFNCSFRPSPRSIRPVYTGGPVLLTKDGQWIITTMGEEALVTQVQTGLAIARIRGASFIATHPISWH